MQTILSVLPSRELRPFINHYLHREENVDSAIRTEPVPARSQHLLQFQFGQRYEIHHYGSDRVETGARVAIVGPQTYRRVKLLVTGQMESFIVAFRPTGFYQLFGIELRPLVDEAYEADTVMGREISEIWERLAEAGTFSKRIEIVESLLIRRACSARSNVAALAAYIAQRRGTLRMSDLRGVTSLSTRQMERNFNAQVGLSPKLYSKILRFESALRIKVASPKLPWSTIAHELLYSDQMHMVHDFQELSGENPTQTLAQTSYGLALKPQAWFSLV